MALQDLTPQLRTRLSRMERAVGWFVILAVLLLGFGFVYYVYNTAERKGWFLTKAPFFCFVDSAAGLKPGDPVMLMGSPAGSITKVTPMAAEQFDYNVYVEFVLQAENIGYVWTEGSQTKVTTDLLLGKRQLEVTRGTNGYSSYVFNPLRRVSLAEVPALPGLTNWVLAQEIKNPTNATLVAKPKDPVATLNLKAIAALGHTNLWVLDEAVKQKLMTAIWNGKKGRYEPFTPRVSKPYWLITEESPAIGEQVVRVVSEIEQALPGILNLTNQLALVLSNSANLTSNLNAVALAAAPAASNLAAATAHLDHPGALGEWLLPTNLNHQLEGTLTSANSALASADSTMTSATTNLAALVANLNRSLDNLAGITSNLNRQVEANTNLLSSVSDAVVHADQFVQGLKHFWLFRHLFETKTNAPPAKTFRPLQSPKGKEQSQ
jgi:hypothetical protein